MEQGGRRMELPDRRKNTYKALEEKLDNHLLDIKGVIRTWIVRGLIGFGFIGLMCTVSLAGFGYLLRDEAADAKQACENRNIRHDNAITQLMAGSNLDQENAPTEAAKAEIRRRRDVTIGIIHGISPKTNCEDPGEVKLIEPQITPPPMEPPPEP